MERTQETLVGHMNLNQIPGAECIMHKNIKGIFIPVENNPGINIWEPDGDKNRRQIKMWMKIIRKKMTDKSGHTHFVKLHINKQTAEMYGMSPDEERSAAVIFGNLKAYFNEDKRPNSTSCLGNNPNDQIHIEDLPPAYPEGPALNTQWE